MPTPVSLARQCLAPDAADALDEAVAVARRRGHAQTTSLHAIAALLSLPTSALRDACARARKTTAYSPRLQFKALELCLSVSLDRVSSTQLSDDPPVSNSLMAAIKRSQANQRRQPENFHLYHQLSHHSSSIASVKVELQHFLLSILDDPVVSRVFSEAGFRSSEIKLAIIRPYSQLLRYSSSRARFPPLFLCNLMECSDPNRFSFPLSRFRDGDENENNRRIGEVLGKNRGRNPLLVGVSAHVSLKVFTDAVENRNGNFLPAELAGVRTICLENDLSRVLSENFEMGSLNMRFVEIVRMVEQSPEPGLIVNFGDLKAFVGDNSSDDDRASHVVGHLKKLVAVHGDKVWLIGAAANYETYLRFVTKFPSIEKDWDLHLLPITSLRAESYPRSSLMGSFVPLAGFFSTPSDPSIPLSGSCQHPSRCLQCDKNCEDEAIAASKGVFAPPVSEQYQSSLPSWMQMTELSNFDGFNAKTGDDGLVLSAKIAGFQKKWDNICQPLHHGQPLKEAPMFPTSLGFQVADDKKEDAAVNNCSTSACVSSHKDASPDLNSRNFTRSNTFPLSGKASNENLLSKLQEETSKTEDLELGSRKSSFSLSVSSLDDENRTSSSSAGSVTTDLGLGIVSLPSNTKLKKPLNLNKADFPSDMSGCCSTNVDLVNRKVCNGFTLSSSGSSPEQRGQMNAMDVKTLFRLLKERVFWQDQAVSIISHTISQRQGSNLRGDIWFNFVGPDKFGKIKVAIALAEVLYGNKDQFICVDLSSQDGTINPDTRCNNAEFRGKTVLDFVASELRKQPLSIVMLENIDKVELLDQNRLLQAIQTGKLSDLQGREVSIKNAIFMTTTTSTSLVTKQQMIFPNKQMFKYSEERLLKAKSWPLLIKVDSGFGDQANRSKTVCNPFFLSKRKLNVIEESSDQHESSEMVKQSHKPSNKYLDLNRPAEENSQHDPDGDCSDNDDSTSEITKAWLQDFCNYMDEVVVFKPFDFDALAEKILWEVKKIFHNVFSSEFMLEIDSKVMEQLLAAAYISYGNREVDDWMEQVLSKKFLEVKRIHIFSTYSIVKLYTCDQEFSLEEKTAEVCLPRRIVLDPVSRSSYDVKYSVM